MRFSFPVPVIKVCITLIPVLLLGACASQESYRDGTDYGTTRSSVAPQTRNTVAAMLASVDQLIAQQNFPAAWSMAERMQNIAPTDAGVWSRLADIRFAQQAYPQAIQLAKKSSQLAGYNKSLLIHNWRLIQQAALGLGDTQQAQHASNQLKRYQQD